MYFRSGCDICQGPGCYYCDSSGATRAAVKEWSAELKKMPAQERERVKYNDIYLGAGVLYDEVKVFGGTKLQRRF